MFKVLVLMYHMKERLKLLDYFILKHLNQTNTRIVNEQELSTSREQITSNTTLEKKMKINLNK